MSDKELKPNDKIKQAFMFAALKIFAKHGMVTDEFSTNYLVSEAMAEGFLAALNQWDLQLVEYMKSSGIIREPRI